MNRYTHKGLYYIITPFLLSWLIILLIRQYGLLDYRGVSFYTGFGIAFFLLGTIIGTVLGLKKPIPSIKYRRSSNYSEKIKSKSLIFFTSIVIFLSLICIVGSTMKFVTNSSKYNTEATIEGLTNLRKTELNDRKFKEGSNVYGVVASTLYGFPVLSILLLIAFNKRFKKPLRFILGSVAFLGFVTTFLSGGRYGAFIFILIAFFGRSIYSDSKNKKSLKFKLGLLSISVFFIMLSSKIFADRMGEYGIIFVINSLPLCKPSYIGEALLEKFPTLVGITMYFEYYVAHAISQLDILMEAPYPKSAPYLGAMEFGAFVLMFNKVGAEIITKQGIVNEIVNPGVYYTQIGALWIDFGYIALFVFPVFFSYYFTSCWKRFRSSGRFYDLMCVTIYIVLCVNTPIVALITYGYFPGIVFAGFFTFIFSKVFPPFPSLYTLSAK